MMTKKQKQQAIENMKQQITEIKEDKKSVKFESVKNVLDREVERLTELIGLYQRHVDQP